MSRTPITGWSDRSSPIRKTAAEVNRVEKRQDFVDKKIASRTIIPDAPEPSIRVVVSELGLQEVFDTWDRFSHSNNGGVYPANAGELTSWSYDAGTQTIESTVNSSTYIGFVSPDTYTDYTIETQITSTNGDNDRLGVVIAYLKDTEGEYGPAGFEYTLSAIRNQDSVVNAETTSWYVVYNYLQGGDIIADGSAAIPYVGTTGWSAFPQGTTIRIERSGDIIKAYSTDPDSTVLKGELIVDLDSDPRLEKFKGSSRVGLSCFSQANAKFNGLELTYAETPNLGRFNEGDTITVNYQTFNVNDNFADYVVTNDGALATDITPPKAKITQSGDLENKSGSFDLFVDEDGTLSDAAYIIKLISRDKTGLATFTVAGTAYITSLQASVQNPSQTPGVSESERMGGDVGYTNDLYLAGVRDYDGGVSGTGIVRVFNSSGTLLYSIDAPDQAEGGQFGEQISTYDGYALISANNETSKGVVAGGKAYLYLLGTSSATLQQTFEDPGTPSVGSSFGSIVDLSADYVLSKRADNGHCFIFNRSGTFVRSFTDVDADSYADDWAIYGDYAVRGRPLRDDDTTNAGIVVVYRISDGATVYTKSSPSPLVNGQIGAAVAINSTYFAASEPDNSNGTPGKVHVYRISDGTLVNSFAASGDTGTSIIRLGEHTDGSVDRGNPLTFAGDDSPIMWVSRQRVNNNSGRVYVFNAETNEQLYLIENPNDAYSGATADNDSFGTSLSFDGSKGLVGAWGAENSAGSPGNTGAIYIYG